MEVVENNLLSAKYLIKKCSSISAASASLLK